jgi:hypothetical protein
MTKDEAKLFRSRRIEPHEIPLRRWARIRGIFEHYECIGDEFIELHEIARQLSVTVPDLSYEAVIQHFKFSVKLGGFPAPGTGFREYRVQGRLVRRAVKDLLDLHNFDQFEPANYPLRPSTLTARTSPQAMRARTSVWVRWIQAKGLPVPPELVVIEHEHDPASTATALPAAEPAPALNGAIRRGARPFKDEAAMARGLELYRAGEARSYRGAADIVFNEHLGARKEKAGERISFVRRLREKISKKDKQTKADGIDRIDGIDLTSNNVN